MISHMTSTKSTSKFYILLILLSIPFWVMGAMTGKGLPLPVNLPVSALMFICPLLSTLILVYRNERFGGIKQLFKLAFDHRKIKDKRWFIPTLVLMPCIMVLSYGVMLLLDRPLPDPNIPIMMLPVFFVLYFFSAVGEELGFMGYLIEPMLARWSPFVSGLMMGAVWAIWHVVPYIQGNNPLTWIVGQCIFTIFARVLIVWLYLNTGGSILPGILFHTMINVSWSLFPNYGSHYDPVITGIITAIIAVILVRLRTTPNKLTNDLTH